MNKKNVIKMTVTPKNDAERARLEKYFKNGKFDFTIRGENSAAPKTDALLEVEEKFCKLANTKRFRATKEENELIKSGKTTREKVIKARIKALEEAQPAAE